jgi:hypothetical protein
MSAHEETFQSGGTMVRRVLFSPGNDRGSSRRGERRDSAIGHRSSFLGVINIRHSKLEESKSGHVHGHHGPTPTRYEGAFFGISRTVNCFT